MKKNKDFPEVIDSKDIFYILIGMLILLSVLGLIGIF